MVMLKERSSKTGLFPRGNMVHSQLYLTQPSDSGSATNIIIIIVIINIASVRYKLWQILIYKFSSYSENANSV